LRARLWLAEGFGPYHGVDLPPPSRSTVTSKTRGESRSRESSGRLPPPAPPLTLKRPGAYPPLSPALWRERRSCHLYGGKTGVKGRPFWRAPPFTGEGAPSPSSWCRGEDTFGRDAGTSSPKTRTSLGSRRRDFSRHQREFLRFASSSCARALTGMFQTHIWQTFPVPG
jgi:hypothetical protein